MKVKKKWTLYFDGASRGNPGLAGVGVFISQGKNPVYKQGFFVGKKTNNEAEYLAFLLGLFFCKKVVDDGDELSIFSDSLLLVKQINGHYKVKKPELIYLYTVAKAILSEFSFYDINHIERSKNTVADKLANKGIDDKIKLPSGFKEFFNSYTSF